MEEKIIKKLKIMIDKAFENNDVPIACIITLNDKIVASEYNKKYLNNDPTAHAELLAIKKACKKLNRTNLSDCKIYTTMFPCDMCNALINEVRIKNVFYILDKEKTVNNNIQYKQMFDKESFFSSKIKKFFFNKR